MVARFLEQQGIAPVILHERASLGKSIIEKIEHYSNVGFAIVLLTPDDEGPRAPGRLPSWQPHDTLSSTHFDRPVWTGNGQVSAHPTSSI